MQKKCVKCGNDFEAPRETYTHCRECYYGLQGRPAPKHCQETDTLTGEPCNNFAVVGLDWCKVHMWDHIREIDFDAVKLDFEKIAQAYEGAA